MKNIVYLKKNGKQKYTNSAKLIASLHPYLRRCARHRLRIYSLHERSALRNPLPRLHLCIADEGCAIGATNERVYINLQ